MDIYTDDQYGLDSTNLNGTGFNDTATHDKTKDNLIPLSRMYTRHDSIEGYGDEENQLEKENVSFNQKSRWPKFVVWETLYDDDHPDPLRIIENSSINDKIHDVENVVYTQQNAESQNELVEEINDENNITEPVDPT